MDASTGGDDDEDDVTRARASTGADMAPRAWMRAWMTRRGNARGGDAGEKDVDALEDDATTRAVTRADDGCDEDAMGGVTPSARALARVDSARSGRGEGGRRLERAGSARESGGGAVRGKSVSFARAISTTIVDGTVETSREEVVGDGGASREASTSRRRSAGGREPAGGLLVARGTFDASKTILSKHIFGVDAVSARDGRSRARK